MAATECPAGDEDMASWISSVSSQFEGTERERLLCLCIGTGEPSSYIRR